MEADLKSVRIDKWLWAARLFKTRTQAADACREGKVTIGGQPVKASRDVRPGEIILAKVGDITRTIQVLGLLEKRVGAPRVKEFALDLTPEAELQKPRLRTFIPIFVRPKGAGRPTKKERRDLEKLSED